jgi:exodeoxyribonuclease VII large subunit
VVWPVLVQGQGAAQQVAAAVRGFSALEPGGPVPRPDLVIVARGAARSRTCGASTRKRWCAPSPARPSPSSARWGTRRIPRWPISRPTCAPTPTAAAELAVPVHGELAALVADLDARRRRATVRLLAHARTAGTARRAPAAAAGLLQGQAQRLDDLGERLRRALGHRTELAGAALARHAGALRPALLTRRLIASANGWPCCFAPERLLQRIEVARGRVDALERLRLQLDPKAPLRAAMCW